MTKDEEQKFLEKFNKLQKEYKVRLSVIMSPGNLFTKIFRKIIRVNWKIYFIDNK